VNVGELLEELTSRGVWLRCSRVEDRLQYYPASALTPELVAEIKEHKPEIIVIMREDERLRETGIIQSERQVFELTQEYFGSHRRENAG
jgi:hypothetical protein